VRPVHSRYPQPSHEMDRRLLVITEFGPASASPAGRRVKSWCRHLPHFGIRPTVFLVEHPAEGRLDSFSWDVCRFESEEPIWSSFRWRPSNASATLALGRARTVLDALVSDYPSCSPLRRLLRPDAIREARRRRFDCVLATAPGFATFGIAKKLSRILGVPWIADYRDDWSTTQVDNGFKTALRRKDRYYERLLMRSAAGFTTVSDRYRDTIGRHIRRPGAVVENGFEEDEIAGLFGEGGELPRQGPVSLIYAGKLYPSQRLDVLGRALSELDATTRSKLQITFLGSDIPPQRIPASMSSDIGGTVQVLGRVSYDESIRQMAASDAMLYIAHTTKRGEAVRGVPSSKLYQYLCLQKPVVLVPSDRDIAERKLTQAGLAFAVADATGLEKAVEALLDLREQRVNRPTIDRTSPVYRSNTREAQAGNLAAFIDAVLARGLEECR